MTNPMHPDVVDAAVPHLRRVVYSLKSNFFSFVCPFRRCLCIIFSFPFLTVSWWIAKMFGIVI